MSAVSELPNGGTRCAVDHSSCMNENRAANANTDVRVSDVSHSTYPVCDLSFSNPFGVTCDGLAHMPLSNPNRSPNH